MNGPALRRASLWGLLMASRHYLSTTDWLTRTSGTAGRISSQRADAPANMHRRPEQPLAWHD
jgi:hypothetical protein